MEYLSLLLFSVGGYFLLRYILKERYFASDEFLARKAELQSVVDEHNELVLYIEELHAGGTFTFGESKTGAYAHLAKKTITGARQHARTKEAVVYAPNVHQCSLQVVTKAQQEPIRYLMKYFGFKAEEPILHRVEEMGESISRLEEAVANLTAREEALAVAAQPPHFIRRHYLDEFLDHMGATFSALTIPYPQYAFEYVSAGGNSSQRVDITLTTEAIDALVETMSDRIRWRKSAAGQRALMTTALREEIKERDGHTCRYCGLSTATEPHLLLEVDHIVPVSRGGLSIRSNLQTLCWKCNRSKSNKIVPDDLPGDFERLR